MSYHTTPASIAAALRLAADRIEALDDIQIDPTWLNISLQAVTFDGTPEGRKATVDALSRALTGHVGEAQEEGAYRTPHGAREQGSFDVVVHTGLADAEFHRSTRGGAA